MCLLRAGIKMKGKFLLITVFLAACSCFAQDNPDKPVPVHFIKMDVFKSISSRLHFDYEYFNGKRIGLEAGVSIFYPNRVFSFINEDFIYHHNLLAFHYRGTGLEAKAKLYFPKKHWKPYAAVLAAIENKYCENANVFNINGFRSSSYSFSENWSGTMYDVKGFILVGFMTALKKGFTLDLNAGLGAGYFDSIEVLNSTTEHRYSPDPRIGIEKHSTYLLPQLHFSVKLSYGWSKK